MRWLTRQQHLRSCTAEAEHALDRFTFTASVDADLRIRPKGPALSYNELDRVIERLLAERVAERVREIVFDFATVDRLETPWTAVLARLISFARHSRARCSVEALHGQAEAVVRLFDSNGVLRSFLRIDYLVGPAGGRNTRPRCPSRTSERSNS